MKRFEEIKVIQSILFLVIPLILICFEGGVLSSISDYVYSQTIVFCVSLTLASALFIYDGFVERKRFYNIILGFSLMGVIVTPYLEYPVIHYFSAALFFLGSVFSIIYFSSKEERRFKYFFCLVVVLGMVGHFVFDIYSLFWAEWIGMLPISIHFALESIGKID